MKWNKQIVILASLLFLLPQIAFPQVSTGEDDREKLYDFWVGTWELEWKDDQVTGGMAEGRNHIEKILDGRVIKENFEALNGSLEGFQGKSYSVYDSVSQTWKQTWVDNQGGYLDFKGKVDGNKRIFFRKGKNPKGDEILQRMVFHDISADSFVWDWEISEDQGTSWKLRWRIFYNRSK